MAAKAKELYKRARSPYWWYRFTNPRTQEQERGSTKTSNRQEAQRFLDEFKATTWLKAEEELNDSKEPKLWIEATTKWIEIKSKKRSIHTDIQRLNIIADTLDEIEVTKINDDLIHKRVVTSILKKRKVADSTINRYLDLIRSILKSCERWGWIIRAPILEKPGKEGERQRKAWLTPKQFMRVREAMPAQKAKLMTLALCTGLRVSNIITLHPSEVDLDNRRIVIPKEKFKSKRDHTVPLNKTAMKILKEELGNHDEAVFTYKGEPFGKINLRYWHSIFDSTGINDELREAGLLLKDKDEDGQYIERFVFHGMRHTFATWLGRSGVPYEIIKAIGGWASDDKNKIVSIYTHIDDVTHLLPFVEIIDSILDGKLEV